MLTELNIYFIIVEENKKGFYNMKKTKLTAFLTAMTVLGSLTMNTSGWSATAETVTPVGLALSSPKTIFSTESVAQGNAKATVYVDVTTEFDETEMVTCINFHLKSSAWGMFDPVNLTICNPNVIGTDNGNTTEDLNFATAVGGLWTTEDYNDVPYMVFDYAASKNFEGYSDSVAPSVIIMSDTIVGKLRTGGEGAGKHLAEFEIMLPEDLPEGEYSIDFLDAYSVIGDVIIGNAKNIDITDLQGITFTVTSDYVEPETTEPPTTEPITTTVTTTTTTKKTTTVTTTTTPQITEPEYPRGDANCDRVVSVRDCALIAAKLSKNLVSELPAHSDYNNDTEISVRDAAAIARSLAEKKS